MNTTTSPAQSLASSLAAGLAVAAKAPAAPLSLSTLAPLICRALGFNSLHHWTARPVSEDRSEPNFYLTRADGLTLFLADSRGGWAAKGRLFIQHSRPRSNGKWVDLWENTNTVNGAKWGSIAAPEITVADSKTPEQIAADIVRRLLPEAERVDGLARAQITRESNAEAARDETAQAIAAAIGAEAETGHDGKPRASFHHRGASVRVNGGDSVRVELSSVTKAQALALIAFMDSDAYRAKAGAEME